MYSASGSSRLSAAFRPIEGHRNTTLFATHQRTIRDNELEHDDAKPGAPNWTTQTPTKNPARGSPGDET